MTDTHPPRPSLAELRAAARSTSLYCLQRHELNVLLDIAEAAQARFETANSTHDADYWFEGDRIETLEAALAKVRP